MVFPEPGSATMTCQLRLYQAERNMAWNLRSKAVSTNLCGLSFACSPCFALNTGADLSPLLACLFCHHFVMFAHGIGFPFDFRDLPEIEGSMPLRHRPHPRRGRAH